MITSVSSLMANSQPDARNHQRATPGSHPGVLKAKELTGAGPEQRAPARLALSTAAPLPGFAVS